MKEDDAGFMDQDLTYDQMRLLLLAVLKRLGPVTITKEDFMYTYGKLYVMPFKDKPEDDHKIHLRFIEYYRNDTTSPPSSDKPAGSNR